jgi:chemotaxis protein methyltransferase CheR
MNTNDFAFIAALLKERSGLIVTADKMYLLEARLLPIARKHDLPGLDGLVEKLRKPFNEPLIGEVVDAMTTNETSFFRDRNPFDALRKTIVPELLQTKATQKTLRIWSAACSTGQEAYSIAMILRDDFPQLGNWTIEIVATDISPSVLARGREGLYSTFEAQRGLPIHLLIKHFDQIGDAWQIKPALRQMVNFRSANLLDDLASLGTFDVIFCRNVLIYFDQATKTKILNAICKRMGAHSSLFLGGAESVFGLCDGLSTFAGLRGVYTRSAAAIATKPAPTPVAPRTFDIRPPAPAANSFTQRSIP